MSSGTESLTPDPARKSPFETLNEVCKQFESDFDGDLPVLSFERFKPASNRLAIIGNRAGLAALGRQLLYAAWELDLQEFKWPAEEKRVVQFENSIFDYEISSRSDYRLAGVGIDETIPTPPPTPASTSGRMVRLTKGLMRSTSASPASMSTPASR